MPHDNQRVTVRDIAARLGLHFTTVAEALRGSARIGAATRERVLAAAQELGYRPDPILSALSAYRSGKRRRRLQGVLGWVHDRPFAGHVHYAPGSFFHDCRRHAEERARRHGFTMEDIWLGAPDMTAPRLARIIKNRGISGLVVAPLPLGYEQIDFPWADFCAVRIGYSLHGLALPVVVPDQFQNTIRLFRQLAARGFRRIGFACPRLVDERVDHGFSGGYLTAREHLDHGAAARRVPLFLDEDRDGSPTAFLAWFRRHRPDAVMMTHGEVYHAALLRAGLRVPGDVAAAWLSVSASFPHDPSGIDESGLRVGETAIDILVAQLHGHAAGIPPYFRKIQIDGIWHEGKSI